MTSQVDQPQEEPYGWVSRRGGSWEPVTYEQWVEAAGEAGRPHAANNFGGAGIRGRRNVPVRDVLARVDEFLAKPEIGVVRQRPEPVSTPPPSSPPVTGVVRVNWPVEDVQPPESHRIRRKD